MSGYIINGNEMGIGPVADATYVIVPDEHDAAIAELTVEDDVNAIYELAEQYVEMTDLLAIVDAARALVQTGSMAASYEALRQAVGNAGW